MADTTVAVDAMRELVEGPQDIRLELNAPDVEVRADHAKREIDMRLLPWEHVIDTVQGAEMFMRGAFAGTDPASVYLYGINHEARMGLGQDGRPVMTRVPIGRAISLSEPEDGAHVTFRVARTIAGDEALALAADGIVTGVSAEFRQVPNGTETKPVNGRRTRVHHRAQLLGATTTPIPAYGAQAAVLAVRSEDQGAEPMATEPQPAPVTTAADDSVQQVAAALAGLPDQMRSQSDAFTRVLDRIDAIETRQRSEIVFPTATAQIKEDLRHRTGQWMATALKLLTGERVADSQMRTLEDLITADNIGVVPDAVLTNELVGIIDPARPFWETTRSLALPASGMTLVVPVIQTRPTVAVQAVFGSTPAEKSDVDSTPTSITNAGFDAITIAGGGDISIQLLKRSDPSYLTLYLQLLAEAYAHECDVQAVATLLDSHPTPGTGYIDPADLEIGEAWTNAVSVSRLLRPDHIWMSTAAIQQFIDAKETTTNAPLYSNLAADITVANGARGLISGLTPVYVPAMDGSGADVIIGPSRGFAHAEDGTFVLQVDVPSKAGRDVALVGIIWLAPLYASAFTTYRLAS